MKSDPNLPKNSYVRYLLLLAIAIALFSLFIMSNRAEGKQLTQTQAKQAAPAVPVTPIPAIIINHNTVNASVIPQSYLDLAAQKNVVFDHHSIGGNIMTGMGTLESQNPGRYSFVSQFAPPGSWFTTHHGTGINIGEYQDGDNSYPQTKIDGFDSTIRNGIGNVANIAFMKFCFLDIYDDAANGLSTWNSYRAMMADLITTYPNTRFVWVTDPLEQALSSAYINREKSLFNNALRQYVQANGGILFDLADIESHDPNGNLITDSQGYEALYSGYAQNQDHHLNSAGQQRTASALWWVFARLSGWAGGTAPTSTPGPSQTSMPVPTFSNTPAPTRTLTPLPTSTNTPLPSALLLGHVTWQGRPSQPNTRQQLPITLTLKSGTTEVDYPDQSTDTSGYFTVDVGTVSAGIYTWRVKNPQYLANSGTVTLEGLQIGNYKLKSSPAQSSICDLYVIEGEMGLMRVGDANNDNIISVRDFNILRQSFGMAVGDPGYDDRSDFTGDRAVSVSDFNWLKQNFGLPGAPPAGLSGFVKASRLGHFWAL